MQSYQQSSAWVGRARGGLASFDNAWSCSRLSRSATAEDGSGIKALDRLDDTLDGVTCALAAWLAVEVLPRPGR